MKPLAIIALLSLGGCATSAAGLAKGSIDATLASSKSPQSVATCAVETMQAGPQLRSDGDHYWIIRTNLYQIPTVRWDFYPDGNGGSRIELRSSLGAGNGTDRVEACL